MTLPRGRFGATGRRSLTRRPHVSQIGKRAGLLVPGIRLTVTETCTGHSQRLGAPTRPCSIGEDLTVGPLHFVKLAQREER
jgi:hypothetical protein